MTGQDRYPNDPLLAEAFNHGRTQEQLRSAISALQSIELTASECLKGHAESVTQALRDIRDTARQNAGLFIDYERRLMERGME